MGLLLDVLLLPLKVLYFIIVFIPWSYYLVYQLFHVGWALFEKKEHKSPERLKTDCKHKSLQLSDVRLHYVEEGDNSKPLLLLVHGFPEFWYSWRFQIEHFAETHHVVAIDQRGYGDSEKPEGIESYNAKLLAKDIKEVIKLLGHEKAILVGHDWGGAVCWFTALMYPEVISKLIIMNCPHPGAMEKVVVSVKSQIFKSWYIFFYQTPWMPEFTIAMNDYAFLDVKFRSAHHGIKNKQNFTDEDLEAWKAAFSQPGALTPPINYYRGLVRCRDEEIENIIKRVAQPPTLIIWGEEDPFLAIECPEYSKKLCVKGKVAYVAGASHWVQQDFPEKVNEIMEEFIN